MKKILTILFFIIVSFGVAQQYTVPKDSLTAWRTKATQRNTTLAEYLSALIYKNEQAANSAATVAVQNSTLTAIKRGVDTTNQNLRSLINKIDTTTKVFIKSFFPAVTYSAASVAMIGATTVQSWSINLGSSYWQMTDFKVLDLGNNFAYNATVLIMNDTINLVENVAPTYTQARARKIVGAMVAGVQINLPWTAGRSLHMVSNTNAASSSNYGIFTGTIYFYHFAAGAQGLANQEIKTKVLFRKIQD